MKIRHPIAIKTAALLAGGILRPWLASLDYRIMFDDPAASLARHDRPKVYLFWHEYLLLPLGAYPRDAATLISNHADGELISQVLRMMRGRAFRGSTTRGGVSAVRKMVRSTGEHLGIPTDGPRGPRRVVQSGAIYLASRCGMPLVPAGASFGDCWRVPSWDRMAIPKPGRPAWVLFGKPIDVPPAIGRTELEYYRGRAQEAMDSLQQRVDAIAAGKSSAGRIIPVAETRRHAATA